MAPVTIITFFFFFLFFLHLQPSISQQLTSFNISHSPWLPTQNKTLISPNNNFTAGFLRSSNSPNLFIFSIWFSNVPQTSNPIVWDSTTQINRSSSLIITSKGELLLNGSPFVNSSSDSNSTELVLHDNGNLVFGNWSSFQNPTNTILHTQNLTRIELRSKNQKFKVITSPFLVLVLHSNSTVEYYNTPNPLVSMDEFGKMTTVSHFRLL